MVIIFWFSVAGLLVIYAAYGVVLFALNTLRNLFVRKAEAPAAGLPGVAVLIAAYNEEEVIAAKILNTMAIDYPAEKLKIYVVSDGSTDGTNKIVGGFGGVKLLFDPERRGKAAAINRAMKYINEEVTVFTDANVMINADAMQALVKHYENKKVGAVSGEKVVMADSRAAAAATEGMYWKYESFLKRQDAELSSLVGAAGELFSIRTGLFRPIAEDTLLDDFMISMNIIRQGYSVKYEPSAIACEKPSSDIYEEYKRKVRISAGGLQTILRTLDIANPGSYGVLSFQYLIHRVSRWTIAPLLILTALFSNLALLTTNKLYLVTFLLQLLFHASAIVGFYLNTRKQQVKLLHLPFYFDFMHYCVLMGWWRFAKGSQKAAWQRSARLSYN